VSEANLAMGAHAPGLMEESPFAVPSKKLVMWLFIISDAVTFAALLMGYGYLRNANPNWPEPFKFSPSSLTMLIGLRAAKAGNKSEALRWTFVTAGAGVLFALLHVREWMGLIGQGVRLFQNPWGAPLFGASFFSITGLHLLHVIGGVVALVVVALGYTRGRYNADHLEVWALYWHFVDLVWMFVVPFVYLLNIAH
jgi:cytochrome c oxidase subunit 3